VIDDRRKHIRYIDTMTKRAFSASTKVNIITTHSSESSRTATHTRSTSALIKESVEPYPEVEKVIEQYQSRSESS